MYLAELSDKQFDIFREVVNNEAGISLNSSKKALVHSRISKRLRKLKIDSFEGYYKYLLDNHDSEMVNFLNVLTTNKTNFFRENRHFEFIADTVLPEFKKNGQDSIRVWSAGCSSGEEPYSIAITFLNFFNKNNYHPDFKILATDIDTIMLEKAKKGIYKNDSLEDIDSATRNKYFLKGSGADKDDIKVKNVLKDIISYRRLNLMDNDYPMKKKFDIIFCRNVIIYFDNIMKYKIFHKFSTYLDDDGVLFLGHSENILSLTDEFKLIGNTIYMKADKNV